MALAVALGTTSKLQAAQQRLTQEQALRLAFPEPARIERMTAFLSQADLERAREIAGPGVEIRSSVVTYYLGRRGGEILGAAYFDRHRVRTLDEVLMIVVGPDDRIKHIEVLRFAEPPEYRPPEGWLRQLQDRALDDELSLKGAIVNLTGATLTSQAVVQAARRVLALHRVIAPFAR
ncbi:MAG: FMN-binding protein [Gemmatimonadales bacterium]|nr:MAG: FMN-binding protein [Gemmatimonadales bacterium]